MNLLLLHPDQRLDGDRWRLDDRQATHVRSVLKLAEGDHCRAGLLDKGTGQAVIESIKNNEIEISFKAVSYTHLTLPTTPYV